MIWILTVGWVRLLRNCVILPCVGVLSWRCILRWRVLWNVRSGLVLVLLGVLVLCMRLLILV